MTPDDPRHGTYAGGRVHREAGQYVCGPCLRAEARYEQERVLDQLAGRRRTIPAIGMQRRLQALAALGHSFVRIAAALDMEQAGAHHLATRPKKYARATTAAKVNALYDAWSMTLPPQTTNLERRAANYVRSTAQKRGWAPPLAWEGIDIDDPTAEPDHGQRVDDQVDDVVVRRILDGDARLALTATPAERRAVVAAWPATGRSINDLARLTGWKPERYTTRDDAAA